MSFFAASSDRPSRSTLVYHLVRDFTDSELRLLIDSVMCSRYIPDAQGRELVEKLERLSNRYFRSRIKHISVADDYGTQNKQFFLTIEALDEAISKGRKVEFSYNEYGLDKNLHLRRGKDGEVRRYVVNPYRMAVVNSRYYLICSAFNYDTVSHYRLDRISDIVVLDKAARPISEIPGLEHGFSLPKHLAEHVNMLIGESVQVSFWFDKSILNFIMDTFANDIQFVQETDNQVLAMVHVNEPAMQMWAEQHPRTVRVTAPQSLVDAIREDLAEATKLYAAQE